MISNRFLKILKFDISINQIVITSNRVGDTNNMTDMNPLHSEAMILRRDMDVYQRTHEIVRACQSNSLIFLKRMRKIAKDMGEDPEEITLQACTCYGLIGSNTLYDKEKESEQIGVPKLIKSHMVVNIGESFIDPSTEVNSLEDPQYFTDIIEGDEIYQRAIAANPTYNRDQHEEEFRGFKEFAMNEGEEVHVNWSSYETDMHTHLDSLERRRRVHPL